LAAGAYSYKMASDLVESMNKVDVAFKKDAASVQSWGKTTLNTLGLSKNSALDMAALFGDMSTSMGISTNKAADMSMEMVELAADLASFKNIQIEVAQTALAGVFTGETESLKRLGIVMTEANLQQYLYSQGVQKRIQDLTQAEKVQLRYNYIFEMTKNAQGDFLRTSEGAANQMRIFQESIKETAASLGDGLLPVITPLIQKSNELLKAFAELTPAQKQLIIGSTGMLAAIGPLSWGIGAMVSNGRKAVDMFGALNKVMAKNPYLVLAAGVSILATALISLKKNHDFVSEGFSNFTKDLTTEQNSMNLLFATYKDTTASVTVRKAAMDQLNTVYKDYMPFLLTEKTTLQDIEKAQKEANDSLIKNIAIKSKQADTEEINNNALQRQKDISKNILGDITKKYGASVAGVASVELRELVNQIVELQNAGKAQEAYGLRAAFVMKYQKVAVSETTKQVRDYVESLHDQANSIKEINDFYNVLIGTFKKVEETTPNINPTKTELAPAMTEQGLEKLKTYKQAWERFDINDPNRGKLKIPQFDETNYSNFIKKTQDSISVYDEVALKMKNVADKNLAFSTTLDKTALKEKTASEQTSVLVAKLEELWEIGARPGTPMFDAYNEALKKLVTTTNALETKQRKIKEISEEIFIISDSFGAIGEGLEEINPEFAKFANQVADFTNNAGNAFAGWAQVAMGNMAALPQALSGTLGILNDIKKGIDAVYGDNSEEKARWAEVSRLNNLTVMDALYDGINYKLERQLSLIEKINGVSKLNNFEKTSASVYDEIEKVKKQIESTPITFTDADTKWFEKSILESGLYDSVSSGASKAKNQKDIRYGEMYANIDQLRKLKEEGLLVAGQKSPIGGFTMGFNANDIDTIEKMLKQVDELEAKYGDLKTAQEEYLMSLSGTTSSELSNDMVSAFEEAFTKAKGSAEAFYANLKDLNTETFNDILKQSVVNAWKQNFLDGKIKDWLVNFEKDVIDEQKERIVSNVKGNRASSKTITTEGLSVDEAKENAEKLANLMTDAEKGYFELAKMIEGLTGGDAFTVPDENKTDSTGLKGAIKGMSEETAGLIAGQFNGLRITSVKIEKNTSVLPEIRDILKNNSIAADDTMRAYGW